jgi:hypothetical protein
MCDEKLLAAARSAAEGMVVDLERARQFTHDWANEKLTNAMVEAALSSCLHRLARTRCWGDANRIASHEFWRIAGPILEAGVLQCRARFKPRGYAGDYQMLQWIVEQYCCDHPLGRAFDRYFQCQAAPAAVRSRTEQIAASLVTQCLQAHAADFHVVSVGAGPASDIHSALTLLPEDHRGRVRLKLLDLDPDALQFARRHVEPLLSPGSLQCSRENLYRLPHVRHAEETLAAPDLLVCAGLFDYLEDDPAVEMLRLFWQRLAEGGLLLVGNFAPHNPTRAYMEWIGNWYLIYRTADDLEKLALQAGIPPEVFSIGSEKLGVDLFIMAQKPAAPRTPPGPSPAPG